MTSNDEAAHQDLASRLELIERMISEGRELTERWGWAYLLWGVGHLAALGWSAVRPDDAGRAWGLTMTACGLGTAAVALARRRQATARSALSRAYSAVWTSFVTSLLVVLAVGAGGSAAGSTTLVAVVLALLGSANFASGLVLRFDLQRGVGAIWWAAALTVRWAPAGAGLAAFVGAALVCEVAFGAWLMARERRGASLG